MRFTDYYNKDILIELSKDKEKLKQVAEEDNGFVLKKMEENNIFPEKEIVQYVGTSPSVIFLLNNYKLSQEEKISLSVNFKSNSVLMKEINQKDVMNDSAILRYLTKASANFSFPGKFLKFDTIKNNVENLIKYDSQDREKRKYIINSLDNISVEQLKELPYSVFRKFGEIYILKRGAFFDDIEHCKIFKSQNLQYPSSDAVTVKEYLKQTGDIQGILLTDSFSKKDIQDFYAILKEKNPNLTMTDLFYTGSRRFRETVITNDLSDDLNIKSIVENYLNEQEFFENDFRFGFDNLKDLPPTLKNHWNFLNVTEWNSKKGKLESIIEVTKNSPRSMVQSNNIGYKLTELIKFAKNKKAEKKDDEIEIFCKNSGDFIEKLDVEKLKEATKVVYERIFTQKQYRNIYINDEAVDAVIQLTENSQGKYAYFALNNLRKDEEKVDLSKLTSGVSPEFIEEFNKMLADPNYYSKDCPIAKMDWYGNWDNISKNHNGEISINNENLYFFSQINQSKFLEKAFKNKEAVLSNSIIKSIRNEVQNNEPRLNKNISKFINIAIKDNHSDSKIKSLINEIKNSKMKNAFFPTKEDDVDNKNLLISNALNAFLELKEFITKNKTFFYNVRNNDDRYYSYEDSENEDPKYTRMCVLENNVSEIKKALKEVESSVRDVILKALPCKDFNDAYILDMMFSKPEIKNDLIVNQLNDGLMSKQEIPNDFIYNLREADLNKFWKRLNDYSKPVFFEAYIEKIAPSATFYNVFKLFSFEEPKKDLDKKLKSIVIEKAPEKILYCHYEQKSAFDMNLNDLYDICKSVSKNEKWSFKRNINTRFAEFVSDTFKRSGFKDYENILELARKEDSAAYTMLLVPSVFYNGNFAFKDNNSPRDIPFSDFKEFSDNYYKEHPELIEYDYSGNRKDVPNLLYLYSKMDLDVVADGMNKIRESLIKPTIDDYEKSGWSNNFFGKENIIELFPIISYADYEVEIKRTPIDKLKDFQKKISVDLVDKLIDKDIANVNMVLTNSYLTDVYSVEKLTTKVLSKVASPDSFRKAFLGVVSTRYDKDNRFYVRILDDNNVNYTFENRKHYYNQGLNRFIEMDKKNIYFLNYTLSIQEKIEENFVRMPFLGSVEPIKDTLNDPMFNGSVYENFKSFKDYINDIENKVVLRSDIDDVFNKYEIPDEEEEDLGFSIKL